ncbi:hypothetical protein GCM10010363_72440 [Streptomyces omiyaensis]|nr:hypothetical protein GCM10010363_72440 [Streptomyces omiyaensis]
MTDVPPPAGAGTTAAPVREPPREQHPDPAGLPVRLGARGRDDRLRRLGDGSTVRLPRATGAADARPLREHTRVPVPWRSGGPGSLRSGSRVPGWSPPGFRALRATSHP